MMPLPPAIQFHNVSKRYTLHHQRVQSLRDAISRLFGGMGSSPRRPAEDSNFYALKDVSFEVERGEALGLIGANGAGKTTIMKLLAGITEPTSGRVAVDGKVAALIEIGAGFHGDLTGRENIYLYGSIMGLRKREIDEKFDSIVGFAELESFIDIPVKRYSSGMYARLGFSVAVHVEPDIVLIDEVLAVGDMSFQRKCHRKMEEIRRSDRVVVFVSHSLPAVESLCNRALWLDHGTIRGLDETQKVVAAYIDEVNRRQLDRPDLSAGVSERRGSGEARITGIQVTGTDGRERERFAMGEDIIVRMGFSASRPIPRPIFGLSVWSDEGLRVCTITTQAENTSPDVIDGTGTMCCTLKAPHFLPRLYFLRLSIDDAAGMVPYDRWDKAASFRIDVPQAKGDVVVDGSWGVVYVPNAWHLER